MKERSTPSRPEKSARRFAAPGWLPLGVAATVVIAGTGAYIFWNPVAFTQPVQAQLPAHPDLSRQSSRLVELLAAAEKQAGSVKNHWEGIEELGLLYHANNFYREAEECWQLMRVRQPREARWCYYLADLRRYTSDYSEMTRLLQETLLLAPEYSPARLQLANWQFKQGEFDQAEHHYRLRLAQLPRDPYARLGLVRLALQKGRNGEAKTELENLLRDAPNFATAHNLYAELLEAAGDPPGAMRHRWLGRETLRYREPEDPWLDALKSRCFDYDRLCTFGVVEFQTENFDPARKFYERAIELRPEESSAYELLSSLDLKQNKPEKARRLLENALPRLKPDNLSAGFFLNLSVAYRTLNQPVEAVDSARMGLAKAGPSAELFDALGLALAAQGRHEEAIEAWQAALARNPRDASANYNLATSLLALDRLDEALAALDRSLILQPTFPPTLMLRGEIEMEAGHWDLAEKYLRPAYESHPENPESRRLLAGWYLHMGGAAESSHDPASAERYYRAGLTVDGSDPELHAALEAFLRK